MRKLRPFLEGKFQDQYAYQGGRGTTDALIHLLDDWTSALDTVENKCVVAVCLDFSKAFDRLQHSILIEKLISLNIHPHIIILIKSFLESRTQVVRVQNSHSAVEPINVGAPQGTKVGPLLWLIYVHDLTTVVDTIKYADDTTLYSIINNNSTSVIQQALDQTHEWSERNNMLLNASKSAAMTISLKAKTLDSSVALNAEPLEWVNSVKFLGVQVDNKLNFDNHVRKITSKCRQRLYFLRVLKRNGMSQSGLGFLQSQH